MDESSSDAAEQRNTDDKDKCINIIKYVSNVNLDNTKICRLGKRVGGKTRPIKIILNNESEALSILRQKRNLPKSRKASIQADQTPMQRDYFLKIKSEIKKREDEGENNLTIRYVKGIPTIVCKTQHTTARDD